MKKHRNITTWDRLDFETLRSLLIVAQKSPRTLHRTLGQIWLTRIPRGGLTYSALISQQLQSWYHCAEHTRNIH